MFLLLLFPMVFPCFCVSQEKIESPTGPNWSHGSRCLGSSHPRWWSDHFVVVPHKPIRDQLRSLHADSLSTHGPEDPWLHKLLKLLPGELNVDPHLRVCMKKINFHFSLNMTWPFTFERQNSHQKNSSQAGQVAKRHELLPGLLWKNRQSLGAQLMTNETPRGSARPTFVLYFSPCTANNQYRQGQPDAGRMVVGPVHLPVLFLSLNVPIPWIPFLPGKKH